MGGLVPLLVQPPPSGVALPGILPNLCVYLHSSWSLLRPTSFPFALLQSLELFLHGYKHVLGHLVLNLFLKTRNEELLEEYLRIGRTREPGVPSLFGALDWLCG